MGATVLNPSGTLNPGTLSVNGQRETANYFSVNGSDVEEDVNAGTAIIPNLDAIAEFRIVTSNFDAEYGEFSGGQISVITKSGSNAFHGGAFDFLRNTDLDARNYFLADARRLPAESVRRHPRRTDSPRQTLLLRSTTRARARRRASIPATSACPRTPTAPGSLRFPRPATAGNQLLASSAAPISPTCSRRSSATRSLAGEPYYCARLHIRPSMRLSRTLSFPRPPGRSRRSACCSTSQLPTPPTAFATSAYNQTVRDDKAGRASMRIPAGACCPATTSSTTSISINPYPVAQSGASVPGFYALTTGRAQLVSLGRHQDLRRHHGQ